MKKIIDSLLLFAAPTLARNILAILNATMKIKVLHSERVESFWEGDKRMILAFWHGRLLMIPYCYHGKAIKTLISQHKDGELLAKLMLLYGHESVRGSSTRGGARALKDMLRTLKTSDVALTPDGPKGPRELVQPGLITLARLSGVPIVPVSFGASKKKVFASWDAFNLPHLFSRGAFMFGEPIYVERDSDMEEKRLELEVSLNNITAEVDRHVNSGGSSYLPN